MLIYSLANPYIRFPLCPHPPYPTQTQHASTRTQTCLEPTHVLTTTPRQHGTHTEQQLNSMRPLHTAPTTRTEATTLRKTGSRVVLQIPDAGDTTSSGGGSRQQQRLLQGSSKNSSLVSNCDTLIILLGIAIVLSVVGMIFVHRLFMESSTLATGEDAGDAAWASQTGGSRL